MGDFSTGELSLEFIKSLLMNTSVATHGGSTESATNNGTGSAGCVADELVFVRQVQLYYSSTVICLGLLGSAFSAGLFFRVGNKPANKASYVHYLVGLNVTCTLYCFTLLLVWLQNVHVNVYSLTGICQHVAFLTQASGFLYKWLLVFLCLDRCLIVSPKPGPRKFCTRCKARCVCLILTCIAIIVFTNLALMEGIVTIADKKMCTFFPEFTEVTDILKKLDVAFNSIVPIILMVMLTIVASYRLAHGKPIADRQEMNGERGFSCNELIPNNTSCPKAGPVCGGCVDMRHSRHFFFDITAQRACAGCTSVISSYYIRRRPFRETDRRSVVLAIVLCINMLFLSGPHYVIQGIHIFTGESQNIYAISQMDFLVQNIVENMAHSSYLVNILAFVVLDKYYRQQLRAMFRWFTNLKHITRCYHEGDVIDTGTPENEDPV